MKSSDVTVILNGLETVARAFFKINSNEFDKFWRNSTIHTISKSLVTSTEERLSSVITSSEQKNVVLNIAKEVKERSSMVTESIKQYSIYVINERKLSSESELADFDIEHPVIHEVEDVTFPIQNVKSISSDSILQKSTLMNSKFYDIPKSNGSHLPVTDPINVIKVNPIFSNLSDVKSSETINPIAATESITAASSPNLLKYHKHPKLSDRAKERKVPSSRLGRAMAYTGLGFGMIMGATADIARKSLGLKRESNSAVQNLLSDNPFLSEANSNRIVDTLCKVRGAALKLGQMLSIQDNAMINPQLAAVFERVRQSADFMPSWQMEKVLKKELGYEWRNMFSEFDKKPFAAASIGQVHRAKLLDGTDVALKIQYPGVAEGIESDIENMKSIINFGNILPKGMYLDNILSVAKRELKREVDYTHEAKCGKQFKKLLESYPQFLIPGVYDDFCTSNVLTTELVYGTPIDKLEDAPQELKNEVCKDLLHLCLTEIFLFRFMQTDPNWSNFLYNFDTKQIVLLDFGACNEYTPEFVDTYMNIIKSSAERDRENVLHFSEKLGFLTGYENKEMQEAHIDAVMILGEAFSVKRPFDFKRQKMTYRIHDLVPVMLKNRLTPPPEETYSLHRKMSGIFLLCTKLGAVIDCSKLFNDVYEQYCAKQIR